jgi:hypothetical protein
MACLATAPAMAKDITVAAAGAPQPGDPAQTTVDSLDYVAGFALDSTARNGAAIPAW